MIGYIGLFFGFFLFIFIVVYMIRDHYFVKNMTLEQAREIAIECENSKKCVESLSCYIQARKILLENGYWVYDENLGNNFLQKRVFNTLNNGDYVKDLVTGEPIIKKNPSFGGL